MQQIGAYFQCYKNPYATYKCLESFRKFYPTSTIVLLSDNGYDYTEMAKYFNCIYIHSFESVPFVYNDINSRLLHRNKLINRIREAIRLIKEDYFIWLEDDVSINNKIKDTFKYDLNGYCSNVVSNFWNINEISKNYKFIKPTKKYVWSGHGGSVFKKDSILNYLSNESVIDDILNNWVLYNFTSNICQDFFLSMIIHFNNGTIGSYEGHYDCPNYKNDNIIVQHQYKVWYNKELPKELEYLIKR